MDSTPVGDEKVKDFVKRNSIIYCFLIALVILAGFQLNLILTKSCRIPSFKSTYFDQFQDVQFDRCPGILFSHISSDGHLHINCPQSPTYLFDTHETFKIHKSYTDPVQIQGQFVWTKCEFPQGPQINSLVYCPKLKIDRQRSKKINIFTILLSSVSKNHFYRMLPLTTHFLSEMHNKGPSFVFQFENYNVIGSDRVSNQGGLWLGLNASEMQTTHEIEKNMIWEVAKENGFVTMFAEENCDEIKKHFGGKKHKWKDSFDVTFVDMFCDNNLKNYKENGLMWKKGMSCLGGGQYVHESVMNFTLQFAEQYKEHSKFASVVFLEGEESSMLRIKTIDSDLRDFIQNLINKEPENTVVLLLSEQGNSQSDYFKNTQEGKYEYKRPFSYIIVPSTMISKGSEVKHLTLNQENLVTTLDFHKTLENLITGKNLTANNDLYDLFHETVPKSRTCASAHIPESLCYCEPYDTHLAMWLFVLLPIMILGWWAFTWCRKRIVIKKKKVKLVT